ncbi:hypothetical protein [Bradyrhizobium sp. S69]|uniref:hypothetical protein n=1 Tax=Bradyrhizobium sp. S69 TaxID=1641856 RepID=UPI00131DDCC1|nr:hypothetical protein [Bradyrhizobium sp. S69]
MTENLFTRFSDRSVRVGQVWIPGKQVEQTLARYAKLLFCLNHSVDHPYSLMGSATAIRWKDRCLLFCCQHQILQYAPDDVVIPTDKSGEILISGSALIWREPDSTSLGEEFLDIRAMRFIPTNYGVANLEAGFFDLSASDCWKRETDATFFLFGYPTSLRRVDYDKPSIDVQQVVTSAKYVGPSNAEGVHRIEMHRTKGFSSDGLSGGPVFHLAEDANGFFVGFSGVMLRGSDTSDIIHLIEAGQILKFFNG